MNLNSQIRVLRPPPGSRCTSRPRSPWGVTPRTTSTPCGTVGPHHERPTLPLELIEFDYTKRTSSPTCGAHVCRGLGGARHGQVHGRGDQSAQLRDQGRQEGQWQGGRGTIDEDDATKTEVSLSRNKNRTYAAMPGLEGAGNAQGGTTSSSMNEEAEETGFEVLEYRLVNDARGGGTKLRLSHICIGAHWSPY